MTSASMWEHLSVWSYFRHIKKYMLISLCQSCLTNRSLEHSDGDIHAIVEGSASLVGTTPYACIINNKSHAGEEIK